MGDEGFDLPAADVQRVFDTAADLGAARFRIEMSWSDTNPSRGVYKWDVADRLVNGILGAGLRPLLILFRRPSWATTADYNVWCTAVATRYQVGGAGIGAANAGKGVTDFEIWNEPNHWMYLPNTSGSVFVPWLQAGYAGVKSVLPGAGSTVVLGGLMQTGNFNFLGVIVTVSPDVFLTQVYRSGGGGYFDAVGNHPYTVEESPVAPSLGSAAFVTDAKLHDIMSANGDAAKQIWWTEFGYPTAMVSQDQQQSYLQTVFSVADSRSYVGPRFVYNLRDSPGGANANEKSFGVVTSKFVEKVSVPWLRTLAPRVLTISPPRAEATASMRAPSLAVSGETVTISPPRAVATAVAFVPEVGGGDVTISPPRAVATATASVPSLVVSQSVTYTFSGTTKPAAFADWGAASYVVAGGVARNGSSAAVDGVYRSGGVWTSALGTQRYAAAVQFYGVGISDRGQGAFVGAASTAVTNCVVALGRTWGGNPHNTSIYTKVGATWTECAGSATVWNDYDVLALTIAETATGSGVFVYSVLRNGAATGLSWTDSGGVITPGPYGGFAFEHRFAGGTQYPSPGIRSIQLSDQ